MELSCSWEGLDMSFEVLKTVHINITETALLTGCLFFCYRSRTQPRICYRDC